MRAQVIVLAGPSGAGKSRLAERVGLPVLRLDDFYKDESDPSVPRITKRANRGIVDWDDPASWLPWDAVTAIEELWATGRAEVPTYDIARSVRTGMHELDLAGSDLFVAEGIFAPEIVADCLERGLLARAFCVRQHPMVTFWRRLTRDLREHRKPPLVALGRGLALMRDQRRVVDHAVELGCQPATADEALASIRALMSG